MNYVTAFTNVLAALVAALGAAGYMYILGGAILWARLRGAGWPTEVPVSLASRSELIVIGAQTLAVLLALAGLLTALTVCATRSGLPAWWMVWGVALGFALGITLHRVFDGYPGLIAFVATTLVVLVITASMFRPPGAWIAGLALLAVGGAASALVTNALIQEVKPSSIALVWITFAGVLVAARSARIAFAQREANLDGVRDAEQRAVELDRRAQFTPNLSAAERQALPAASRTAARFAEELRRKYSIPIEGARRTLWRWGRWVALAAVALFFLGGIAVAAQLDKDRDFNRAVVRLDSGRCLHGTYLGQDDKRVVLGGRSRSPLPRRIAILPVARVKAIRIQAPRNTPAALVSRPCVGGTLPVSVSSNGGTTTVVRGPRGPKGDTGVAGPRGPAGERGPRGDQGERGRHGATGDRGPPGLTERGPAGDQGPRGERGPKGDRGERGPRGDRGERGPRGRRGVTIVEGRG